MSMMPHWLDEVFRKKSAGDKDAARTALIGSGRLDAALDQATFAYREKKRGQEEQAENGGPVETGSPEQEARLAFIKAIDTN